MGLYESDSAWCSPCVPIVKPDRRVRLYIAYRRLNQLTPQLQQVIPIKRPIVKLVLLMQEKDKENNSVTVG